MARAKPELHGVLVVDKPSGMTSHDVVARVRRVAGQREVGHAGTLDPMASGVLVVLLGEATKLTPWVTADDKRYACTLQLGVETASGDADGEEVARAPVPEALRRELAAWHVGDDAQTASPAIAQAIAAERERKTQVPPAVSAIHVDGERAYARARRGETVELEPRPVEVRAVEVSGTDAERATLSCTLHASKGYYVRAFARDLAAWLGTLAHLVDLRRLASGTFTLADALPFPALEREAIAAALVPCEAAAARVLPVLRLTTELTVAARQGKRFAWPADPIAEGPHAWLDEGGKLVAVGEPREGLARVVRGFFAAPAQSG
jgi:tRNA pseudouridine55 synthase